MVRYSSSIWIWKRGELTKKIIGRCTSKESGKLYASLNPEKNIRSGPKRICVNGLRRIQIRWQQIELSGSRATLQGRWCMTLQNQESSKKSPVRYAATKKSRRITPTTTSL